MSEYSKNPAKPMDVFRVRRVKYIGEQDGPAEREFKEELIGLLSHKSTIRRAYLARVSHGQTDPEGVALCLCTGIGPDDRLLVHQAGAIFASMFNAQEHLDVLFLKRHEEIELARVCRPFFDRETSQ